MPTEIDHALSGMLASIEQVRRAAAELIHKGDDTPEAAARRLLYARARRNEAFSPGLFGDPAWDLLLNLFIARSEERELRMGQSFKLAGLTHTTGLRWLEKLEREGLVVLMDDPLHGRAKLVSLSTAGDQAMTAALSRMG